MSVKFTPRAGATRNQAAADFQVQKFCLRENRFISGPLKNADVAVANFGPYQLIQRDPNTAGGFLPVLVSGDLVKSVGVSFIEGIITVAAGASRQINVVNKGEVNGKLITLPDGVTFDTMVGNFSLKDLLNNLGLEINTNTVDHTFFDN